MFCKLVRFNATQKIIHTCKRSHTLKCFNFDHKIATSVQFFRGVKSCASDSPAKTANKKVKELGSDDEAPVSRNK